MPSPWFSYLPPYLSQELLAAPQRSPIGIETRFQAVTLFADVSGFTAISEALGHSGKNGAEELTTILNGYFGPMISLIHHYGGMVAKFGGDAMTVVFPCSEGQMEKAARRAVACALEMQERMSNYAAIPTSVGTFGLAMKAGLACGTLFRTVVGDAALRLEHILAGEPLDLCAEAEHHATRGEVVIHKEVATLAKKLTLREQRDDFFLVAPQSIHISPAPLDLLPEPPEILRPVLAAFMHPSIASRLAQEQVTFINEHRKVTTIFLRFDGFDYNTDPLIGARLQAYFANLINIVARYDGYLNKIDMGDKGSKAIILFGAPITHEDDAERALRCALDIRALPQADVHIGINTGYAFCGQVGSALRQEYTVMGDAVNLAARLMQAAQANQILVSESTRESATHGSFHWDEEKNIQVKGKSAPVSVAALLERVASRQLHLQEPHYHLPMVGRQAELKIVRNRLNRVLLRQGQIIGITAEAGMGKSRLGAEIIKMAQTRGLTAYGGECLSHGTSTPYLVWQPLLRNFFDIPSNEPPQAQIKNLQARLRVLSPNLAVRAPLLGNILGISIPENEVTASMNPKLRKTALENLVVECFRTQSTETPLLLVLEDTHWIDPLSNELLEAVGRNIADIPVMLLTLYRPAERYQVQPAIKRFAHFTEIALQEFTPQEAAQLINLKLGQISGEQDNLEVPGWLVTRITERAQGNPFYIDEIINLMRDQKVDFHNPQMLETLELPDSLHSLVLSRIDQLNEAAKTTLKVASVIGRAFRAFWLWGIYPKVGAPSQVIQQLEELHRLDITPLDKPAPELEYLFKHIVTREVAYESLAHATRKMLHGQAGHFIEHTYPQEINRFLDLLAYHYGKSENAEKQRLYFRKAGEAAMAAYANQAAIDYYQRLAPLVEDEERLDVLLQLANIYQHIGNWKQAEALAEEAHALAQTCQQETYQVRARHLKGKILMLRGEYAQATDLYQDALTAYRRLDYLSNEAEALLDLGIVYWSQSDYQNALRYFEQAETIARQHNLESVLLRALGNRGLVEFNLGQLDEALRDAEEGYHTAMHLNDRFRASALLGNIANIYLNQGLYSLALEKYSQSLQTALEIGDRQGVSIGIGNMGNVYLRYGMYTQALACFTKNLQISLEIGDTMGIGFVAWNIANAYLGQRQLTGAAEMVRRAITINRLLDTPYELCEALHTQGRIFAAQKQYAMAFESNHEALEIAAEIGYSEIHFQSAVGEIRLQHAMRQIDTQQAIAALRALQEKFLDQSQDDVEAAEVVYRIWKFSPTQKEYQNLASRLYRTLHEQAPNVEYRDRYFDLTGENLSEPPALPPLPESVTEGLSPLNNLLQRVDAFIEELRQESKGG